MTGQQLADHLHVTPTQLGNMLGLSRQTIYTRWAKGIPVNRVLMLERRFGIPRETLRPDLYRRRKRG